MSKPNTAVVLGAGGRGAGYAAFALEFPERLKIVGVAEPRQWNREQMAGKHHIPAEAVFTDWQDLAARPRMADAAIICTQDAMHEGPAIELAAKGYHLLLEKPMAPTEDACVRITEAVKKAGLICAVCHVMRYTSYTQALKKVLGSGEIGEIVSVQHLEPLGYWHQAHSFVRGNWRNTAESSFMLLAKSCHDLDWLRYVVDSPCLSVSSFGSLKHFRREAKPEAAGNAKRCLDCAYDPMCPYSARKIYLKAVEEGRTDWPVSVLAPVPTVDSVTQALREGPYGRCVYECDNDVVDHQVVNFAFEGERTAVFTMTAFNEGSDRKTRIFGTRGEIYGDGQDIEVYDFLTDKRRSFNANAADSSILGGHGGGDYGLMDRFTAALAANDPSLVLSGVEASLESHRMVFAAEKARLEHRVVDL